MKFIFNYSIEDDEKDGDPKQIHKRKINFHHYLELDNNMETPETRPD